MNVGVSCAIGLLSLTEAKEQRGRRKADVIILFPSLCSYKVVCSFLLINSHFLNKQR